MPESSPSASSSHSRRRRSGRRRNRISPLNLILGCGLFSALAAAGIYFSSLHPDLPDMAGVWRDTSDNRMFMIDHEGGRVWLSENGTRLSVTPVSVDAAHGILDLKVLTASGLSAEWVLTATETRDGMPDTIQLSQDGIREDSLVRVQTLTPGDWRSLRALPVSTTVRWSPALDCHTATAMVPRMLCTDQTLAAADQEMAKQLREGDAYVRSTQAGWESRLRDQCIDLGCLKDVYHARLMELHLSHDAAEVARLEGTLGTPPVKAVLTLPGSAPASVPEAPQADDSAPALDGGNSP